MHRLSKKILTFVKCKLNQGTQPIEITDVHPTENELKKLYNTLLLVETKGESTRIMAGIMDFVNGLIEKAKKQEKEV